MPLSRFASQIRLRLPLPARAAPLCVVGRAIFSLVLLLSALLPGAPARAQEGENRSALGDAAAARVRALRFLAGRHGTPASLPPSGSTSIPSLGTPVAEPITAARLQRAATLPRLGLRPEISTSNLAAVWQPLGPSTVTSLSYGAISGRITSVAVDPNDPSGNTVWLGTTGGGVWKSANAAGPLSAASFAPLTDTLPVFSANEGATTVPSLSIGAVAVQPASTGIVLAGTGDPNDVADSYYGEGILRSADGGQTWTLATGSRDGARGNHSFAGLATAGIAWSTVTPTLAVAALTTSLEGTLVSATNGSSVPGLYYSVDAGVTWKMASVYDGTQSVQLPEPAGFAQSSNNATAVVWDAQRGLFFSALSGHGYYSSPDGKTWTRLPHQPGTGLSKANCPVGANGAGSSDCPIFRGVLAVQPATGDLYALTVDANSGDQGLWQDLCNATAAGTCANPLPVFATRIDGGALEVGQGASGASTTIYQGTYDLALAAGPDQNNGTVLLAGTLDLYRCELGAGAKTCTWRNTTNAGNGCNATASVAPAQHALAMAVPSSGNLLVYVGNDGGLWRSTDGVAESGEVCSSTDASHFENLNAAIGSGGSLAQVVGFAQDPVSPETLIAGMGANGSAATASASALSPWPQLSAGEGGFPLIDPVTRANWFVAVGAGVNLSFCDLGSACGPANFLAQPTVGQAQVGGDYSLLDPPALLDPQAPTNLLTATCRVWRGPAQDSNGWSAADALSPVLDGSGAPCGSGSALIRSLGPGGPSATGTASVGTGSTVLYAGMAGALDGGGALGGHLFVTESANAAAGSATWTDVSYGAVVNGNGAFNASGFDVSAVVADSHDPSGGTVYATIMGFGQPGTIPHVYRSGDFGAHWTDISANLPNAPANSLVVDPNDANTIYLATDLGVYVTRTVSTCGTANCWSPLGSGLPNAPVTQLQAGAESSTGDGRLGMLRAATYGRGIWQTPLLSAIAALQPGLTASVMTLTFGAQAAATESAPQTFTLTSNGSSPVTVSSLSVTGDFVETDTCTGQTIAVGSTCSVSVQFAPTKPGTRTGLLTVFANIAGGQITVSLSGTATAPAAIVLTPLSLAFPSTVVQQTAPPQIITVSNTGANAATLQGITVNSDFTVEQNTCGASLPPQTGCSVSIGFRPTASGLRGGQLTVSDSAGTQTAQLSGTGQAPATDTLAPGSLSFSQQQVGTISAPQQITLTNAGDVPLILISAAIVSGDFAVTNGCSSSLAPHSSCAISVTFVPTAVGTRTGSVKITDGIRYQLVPLNGAAVAPPGVSLSPATVNFDPTGVGQSAAAQTVTLTNNGGVPLGISSTAVSGDFTIVTTTCGNTLNVGEACTMALLFTPTAAGPRTGALLLQDNAQNGKQTVNLSGIGIDFGLVANGATSVTVASGTSATFPLALHSLAGLSGSVALTCSGAPAHSLCTVSPASAALGSDVLVSLVVQTGMSTAEARPWRWRPQPGDGTLFYAAAPFAWIGLRRKRRQRAGMRHKRTLLASASVALALALVSALLAGCGAAREIPLGGGGSGGGTVGATTPTPSGTYQIQVVGSAAGVTHAVNLSLTIQ